MELDEQRQLEAIMDTISQTGNDRVVQLCAEANRFRLQMHWDEFRSRVREAEEIFKSRIRLGDFLLDRKLVASMSEARRSIKIGAVTVDGIRAKNWTQDISQAETLTVHRNTYKLKDKSHGNE